MCVYDILNLLLEYCTGIYFCTYVSLWLQCISFDWKFVLDSIR